MRKKPQSSCECDEKTIYTTSMCSMGHEFMHADKPQGIVGSSKYKSLCARIYSLSACTHIHIRHVRDDDAVTGVPHLRSCVRVPELALGQKNHVNDTKTRTQRQQEQDLSLEEHFSHQLVCSMMSKTKAETFLHLSKSAALSFKSRAVVLPLKDTNLFNRSYSDICNSGK